MDQLETRLREFFDQTAAHVTIPPSVSAIRQARRRQAGSVAFVVVAAGALAALSLVVGNLMSPTHSSVPGSATVETEVHGVAVTIPDDWIWIDPAVVGMPEPLGGAPHVIAVLSASDPSSLLDCTQQHRSDQFLLTLRQRPFAEEGPASHLWPVPLTPLASNTSLGQCYADWKFLSATWTEAGRSFEARVGIGPNVSAEDRQALFAAFSSMTFKPMYSGPTSATVASGATAGEEWSVTAGRDADGLVLSVDWTDGGAESGGFRDTNDAIHARVVVLKPGDPGALLLYGAVQAGVARLDWVRNGASSAAGITIADVPNELDPQLDAFAVEVTSADLPCRLIAYGADGMKLGELVVDRRWI
jgi:hypothetical protein